MGISHRLTELLELARERFTSFITIITGDHRYIHDGKFFEGAGQVVLSAGGTTVYQITTPNTASGTYLHYRWGDISSSGDKVTITLHENAIVSSGTTFPTYNHNRNSTAVATATIKQGVTLVSAGTTIDTLYIGGGTGVGGAKSGGTENGAEHEWVLKQDTTYAIKVSNGSASSNTINGSILFYEESNG